MKANQAHSIYHYKKLKIKVLKYKSSVNNGIPLVELTNVA